MTEETPVEEIPRHLNGVNGWLLFFCVTTGILGPILYVAGARHAPSPIDSVIDLAFGGFAAVTCVYIWRVHWRALGMLRIYLLSVFCLAGLNILGAVAMIRVAPGGLSLANSVPLLDAVRSLLIPILWWQYFRRSRRVLATFGVNMGSLRELFPPLPHDEDTAP